MSATAPAAIDPADDYARFRRDIVSAYLVTFARIASWITVTAAVYRVANKPAYAMLGLVQSTVGILEYAAVGLAPAIIRVTAEAIGAHIAATTTGPRPTITVNAKIPAIRDVYANGMAMAWLTAAGGGLLLGIFLFFFRMTDANRSSHGVALELSAFVGIATLLRMVSDAPGAALQTSGKIFVDNILLCTHEVVWGVGTILDIELFHLPWQRATGLALLIGSILVLILRLTFSHRHGSGLFARWWTHIHWQTVRRLLIFGGMVVAAQMADYLYSPTNNLLINRFISLDAVGEYTPAVQVDGGLLLAASALAMVLLPRTALAHAGGDMKAVRKYYIRGTLATAATLLLAYPIAILIAPHAFKLWLGSPLPLTCAILPFVLIHTVIGGSSAVGRSVLLAIGKVRPFTISVLIAGIANVLLSFTFVYFFGWGLRGIVFGTILAVTGRCAIWLPWYTLRQLRIVNLPTAEPTPLSPTTPPLPMP